MCLIWWFHNVCKVHFHFWSIPMYEEALWQGSSSGDHIGLILQCTGCRCKVQGKRRGIATMHLAADGTRAAGNLDAHNQPVMNLSDQPCVMYFCIIRQTVCSCQDYRTIWHHGQFDTTDNLTPDNLTQRTIWHRGQFYSADNLTPWTIWHCGQFDTMGKNGQFDTLDHLTPWVKTYNLTTWKFSISHILHQN